MSKNTLVYIGRFQPFHNAHLKTILYALKEADQVVIVIGSSNQPRDDANPFTQAEREEMIRKSLEQSGAKHLAADFSNQVKFVYVENSLYNNALWAQKVALAVDQATEARSIIKLIGHSKDESSFYLKMFPQWGTPIEMPLVEILDATTIREMYFSSKCNLNFFKNVVPNAVCDFLGDFMSTPEYRNIVEEMEYIKKYKRQFEGLAYPPTFITGDCVVFKDNHVVLIERKAAPGKGLMALPGGFMNANTDLDVCETAVRELYEETKIKVPEKIIRKSIVEEKVFSALGRSRRGRVVTTAQFIVLDDPDNPGLPKLKGTDDAKRAVWVPLHTINRNDMFEDHYDMIMYFAGRYNPKQK